MRSAIVSAALFMCMACDSPTGIDLGALTFQKLSLGLQHTCGLSTEGIAYCWGEGGVVLGSVSPQVSRPLRVAGDRRYFEIATGTHTTCALNTEDSTAFCWGRSGDESWSSPTPTRVSTIRFKAIDIGLYEGNHCGLTGDGEVFCWGGNTYGQVGNGTRAAASIPTAIASSLRAKDVAAGFHTCLLSEEGSAHCWGSDIQGAVGRSTTPPSCDPVTDCMVTLPTPVIGGHTFSSISIGGGHTCALTAANVAWCWGNNRYGEVGADAHPTRCLPIIPCNPAPVAVAGVSFASITAGPAITCGVATDGRGYCWGYNEEAQLGNGNQTSQSRPVPVSGSLSFRAIYPGLRHTCGISTSGHAYCWGNNVTGALGIGSFEGIFTTPHAVRPPAGD